MTLRPNFAGSCMLTRRSRLCLGLGAVCFLLCPRARCRTSRSTVSLCAEMDPTDYAFAQINS